MSSNESDKPREEKPTPVDMRAALLPESPADVDMRATASAPPPIFKPETTPESPGAPAEPTEAAPDIELEAALAGGFDMGIEGPPELAAEGAVEGSPGLSDVDLGAMSSELVADAAIETPAPSWEDLEATTEFTSLSAPSGDETVAEEVASAEAPPPEAAEGEAAAAVAAASGTALLAMAGEEIAEAPAEEAAEEEEKEPTPGLFARIAEHINAYDMLLGVAFVALLLGALCLAYELSSYNWDTQARSGRQPVSAVAPARPVSADMA